MQHRLRHGCGGCGPIRWPYRVSLLVTNKVVHQWSHIELQSATGGLAGRKVTSKSLCTVLTQAKCISNYSTTPGTTRFWRKRAAPGGTRTHETLYSLYNCSTTALRTMAAHEAGLKTHHKPEANPKLCGWITLAPQSALGAKAAILWLSRWYLFLCTMLSGQWIMK